MKLEFDYVIAGGGSAGCALASRLCEDKSITVCMFEACLLYTSPSPRD